MSKKRILFVTDVFIDGGAEKMLTNIMSVDSLKFSKQLVILNKEVSNSRLEAVPSEVEIIRGGSRLTNNSILKIFYSIIGICFLFKVILNSKPDVIFVNKSSLSSRIGILIPFCSRRIFWIARETTSDFSKIKKRFLLTFLYKKFLPLYSCVIAQCYEMKDNILEFLGQEVRIKVMYNFLSQEDENIIINSEKLPTNKINLVCCGRLSFQKGFDLLLESFSHIKNLEKYHLTIIGGANANDSNDISSQINQIILNKKLKDKVTLVGHQDNIYNWIANADVFILSSRFEGFPNIVLESLNIGVPVLSTNCAGGITEIINNSNGVLFSYFNDDFEDKLEFISTKEFDRSLIKSSLRKKFGYTNNILKYNYFFEQC